MAGIGTSASLPALQAIVDDSSDYENTTRPQAREPIETTKKRVGPRR
jgi:hypothetical protein